MLDLSLSIGNINLLSAAQKIIKKTVDQNKKSTWVVQYHAATRESWMDWDWAQTTLPTWNTSVHDDWHSMRLIGDCYSGRSGKRQVSLIPQGHLAVIASILKINQCPPELIRLNISVSGINLLPLKGNYFRWDRPFLNTQASARSH